MDAVPALFDRVPSALFAPLSGSHATLYWSVLAAFYACEFERDPFHLVKEAALEITERVLLDSAIWRERREDLASDLEGAEERDDPRVMARRVLTRLETAGWFHFEYRGSIGLVLNFYPYAARILDALVRVARDEQPAFQGFAHSIASLLRPESFRAKPGVALFEAKRHTLDLVRELKILNRNIYAFTRRILDEARTASDVLAESFDRYRDAVQENYHRLKTVENLFRFRGDILHWIDQIEGDAHSCDRAARWYSDHHQVDLEEASLRVQADLRLLRMQFETMPEVTDDIDARNARFSGVVLRKLSYLLRQDARMEGQLQYLVDALAGDGAPELEFDVFRCELLGEDCLYTLPRRREQIPSQPLAEIVPIDRERVRREVQEKMRRPHGRTKIVAFVDALLRGRRSFAAKDVPLENDGDYVRLFYVSAFGLDGYSSYRFRALPETIARGIYRHPAGTIERRRGS